MAMLANTMVVGQLWESVKKMYLSHQFEIVTNKQYFFNFKHKIKGKQKKNGGRAEEQVARKVKRYR